jgi:hypothetical protein
MRADQLPSPDTGALGYKLRNEVAHAISQLQVAATYYPNEKHPDAVAFSSFLAAAADAATALALGSRQRLVPVNANTFWILAPNSLGTANGYKFLRNSGDAAEGGVSLGVAWPAWRLTAVYQFSSTEVDPTSATPIGSWSDDVGAQDAALRSSAGLYGNSFHGIGSGTLTLTEVRADGLAVSHMAPARASRFSVFYQSNPAWATGETATVYHTVTIGSDGVLGKVTRIVSASNFAEYYTDMTIANGAFDEAFVGDSVGALGGFKADVDDAVLPGFSVLRLRNSTTGYTVTEVSDAPSKTGFSRDEVRPSATIGTRLKGYYRAAGVPGDVTVTSSTAFGVSAAGASAFGTSVVMNGTFPTDLGSWAQTSGTTTQSGGAATQSSQTGGVQTKITQLIAGLDITAYYVFKYTVAMGGTAPNIGNVIAALGINTNGSTTGANGLRSAPSVAGRSAMVFKPTQAQLQVILGIQATAAAGGITTTFDDVELRKLA